MCSQVYSFLITRNTGSSDATLSSLLLSTATGAGATLTPAFVPTTTSYTATVPYTVPNVFVTATVHHPASMLIINGWTTASGSPSSAQPVAAGATATVTVQNVAEAGNAQVLSLIHI